MEQSRRDVVFGLVGAGFLGVQGVSAQVAKNTKSPTTVSMEVWLSRVVHAKKLDETFMMASVIAKDIDGDVRFRLCDVAVLLRLALGVDKSGQTAMSFKLEGCILPPPVNSPETYSMLLPNCKKKSSTSQFLVLAFEKSGVYSKSLPEKSMTVTMKEPALVEALTRPVMVNGVITQTRWKITESKCLFELSD